MIEKAYFCVPIIMYPCADRCDAEHLSPLSPVITALYIISDLLCILFLEHFFSGKRFHVMCELVIKSLPHFFYKPFSAASPSSVEVL